MRSDVTSHKNSESSSHNPKVRLSSRSSSTNTKSSKKSSNIQKPESSKSEKCSRKSNITKSSKNNYVTTKIENISKQKLISWNQRNDSSQIKDTFVTSTNSQRVVHTKNNEKNVFPPKVKSNISIIKPKASVKSKYKPYLSEVEAEYIQPKLKTKSLQDIKLINMKYNPLVINANNKPKPIKKHKKLSPLKLCNENKLVKLFNNDDLICKSITPTISVKKKIKRPKSYQENICRNCNCQNYQCTYETLQSPFRKNKYRESNDTLSRYSTSSCSNNDISLKNMSPREKIIMNRAYKVLNINDKKQKRNGCYCEQTKPVQDINNYSNTCNEHCQCNCIHKVRHIHSCECGDDNHNRTYNVKHNHHHSDSDSDDTITDSKECEFHNTIEFRKNNFEETHSKHNKKCKKQKFILDERLFPIKYYESSDPNDDTDQDYNDLNKNPYSNFFTQNSVNTIKSKNIKPSSRENTNFKQNSQSSNNSNRVSNIPLNSMALKYQKGVKCHK